MDFLGEGDTLGPRLCVPKTRGSLKQATTGVAPSAHKLAIGKEAKGKGVVGTGMGGEHGDGYEGTGRRMQVTVFKFAAATILLVFKKRSQGNPVSSFLAEQRPQLVVKRRRRRLLRGPRQPLNRRKIFQDLLIRVICNFIGARPHHIFACHRGRAAACHSRPAFVRKANAEAAAPCEHGQNESERLKVHAPRVAWLVPIAAQHRIIPFVFVAVVFERGLAIKVVHVCHMFKITHMEGLFVFVDKKVVALDVQVGRPEFCVDVLQEIQHINRDLLPARTEPLVVLDVPVVAAHDIPFTAAFQDAAHRGHVGRREFNAVANVMGLKVWDPINVILVVVFHFENPVSRKIGVINGKDFAPVAVVDGRPCKAIGADGGGGGGRGGWRGGGIGGGGHGGWARLVGAIGGGGLGAFNFI
jgi:hypothetical protein